MLAYVSLYRKYRPQSFSDVVGQTHVTRTLQNAIAEDRLHHAYLFTGPRGTGKTSTARILAKSINCAQGPTATPCGECDMCVAITNGTSVDVIELDMASHGGVDDARELRDRALFAPAQARRKVYILDEVHMASTAAFNALLKLIEEPPGHVLFAMATTDPQKVIPTIMSRVQRLDLRRVGAADVGAHVRRLCELEGYAIEDEAVEAVVRAGEGSVRDTLSVLEQVLAYSGPQVTSEKVGQVLGQTPAERTFETVDLVAGRDLAALLGLVQGLLDGGHDLRRFAFDLLQHLRDLLVLQVAPDRPDLVDATDDRRERLAAQCGLLPRESLLRAVNVLAETVVEMRQGPPRLPLELALAKLAVPELGGDTAGLADRVARLEAGAPAGGAIQPTASAPVPATPAAAPELAPVPARTGAPEPAAADAPGPAAEPAAADAPGPAPERDPAPTDGSDEAPPEPRATDEPGPAPAPTDEPGPAPAPTLEERPEAVEAPRPASSDAPAPRRSRGEELADRAHRRAGTAPKAADADPVEEPEVPVGGGGLAGRDELPQIQQKWDVILDLVRSQSPRFHAIFEPGQPVDLRNGILTLEYGPRYASFHAENAKKGEFSEALRTAVERCCGVRVRVDTRIAGEGKRRPQPPVVTDAGPAEPDPDPEEAAAVREAELTAQPPTDPEDAAARVEELLTTELGAEKVEESPAPDR